MLTICVGKHVNEAEVDPKKATKFEMTGKGKLVKDEVRSARFYCTIEQRLKSWVAYKRQAGKGIIIKILSPLIYKR